MTPYVRQSHSCTRLTRDSSLQLSTRLQLKQLTSCIWPFLKRQSRITTQTTILISIHFKKTTSYDETGQTDIIVKRSDYSWAKMQEQKQIMLYLYFMSYSTWYQSFQLPTCPQYSKANMSVFCWIRHFAASRSDKGPMYLACKQTQSSKCLSKSAGKKFLLEREFGSIVCRFRHEQGTVSKTQFNFKSTDIHKTM